MGDDYSSGTTRDTLESLKAERADLEKTVLCVQQMTRDFDTLTERRKSFDAKRVSTHLQLKGPHLRRRVWAGILSPEGFQWHKEAIARKKVLGEQLLKDFAAFCQALVAWAEDLEKREQRQKSALSPSPSVPIVTGENGLMPDEASAPNGANEPAPVLNDAGIVLGAVAGTGADAIADTVIVFGNMAGPEKASYNPFDRAFGYQNAFWKMFGFTSRPFGARTPAENAQLGEAFENAIFSLYGHGVFPGQEPHVSTDPNGTPVWLQNVLNGANFNRSQAPVYPYNELYVQDPSGGYPNRLDSYNPFAGEIVSRKLTQFSAIQPQTGINYVNEVAAKYAPGTVIADVPTSGNLAGKRLSGQMILEVPPQNAPIPQAVLDAADAQKILIRDIKGHVY